MPRTVARSLLMLGVVIAAGCAPTPLSTTSPPASPSESAGGTVGGSAVPTLPALPADFPVVTGAIPVDEADRDPALIGAWTIDEIGSQTYDFYVAALPEAGYRLAGEYPGGAGAIIRLRTPRGEVWQLVLTPDESGTGTRINLRLDQE